MVRIKYRTPTVTSIGGRNGTVRRADRLIGARGGDPEGDGRSGRKTNPEELFAAGYAAYFHSALKGVTLENTAAMDKSVVEARVEIGPNDGGGGYGLAVELHVILPGADAETAKDLVRKAHRPYSNATRNNVEVKLTATPADGHDSDVT